MEPSRKSHAIESSLFMWLDLMPDDVTESVDTHVQLEAAAINHLHDPVTTLMFGSFGTQIINLRP